jgi:hypothetical protein
MNKSLDVSDKIIIGVMIFGTIILICMAIIDILPDGIIGGI